jgi:soluble cytochrome b562
MMHSKSGIPMLAAAALLITACVSPKREECRSLTTLINTGADQVEKAQSTALDPAGLKTLAEALEKSATGAEALKLTDPELQKQAKEYAVLMREVAKTAQAMSAAASAGDLEKAKAASSEMEKHVGYEPKVIAAVNKVCAAE